MFFILLVASTQNQTIYYVGISSGTILILVLCITIVFCLISKRRKKNTSKTITAEAGKHDYNSIHLNFSEKSMKQFLIGLPPYKGHLDCCLYPSEGVAVETQYEEIRDSRLDPDIEEDIESDWSREMDELSSDVNDDGIHYYIQPVNEYENTELTVYENYMESGGYEDPVSNWRKKEDESKTMDGDGYEIPVKAENVITYKILSRSPVELVLTVDDDSVDF